MRGWARAKSLFERVTGDRRRRADRPGLGLCPRCDARCHLRKPTSRHCRASPRDRAPRSTAGGSDGAAEGVARRRRIDVGSEDARGRGPQAPRPRGARGREGLLRGGGVAMSSRFVHLHVHSEYSVLDSSCRLPELLDRAAQCGMGALALTDHGVMSGLVKFYREAQSRGIHPILGCEVYVAPGRPPRSLSHRGKPLLPPRPSRRERDRAIATSSRS